MQVGLIDFQWCGWGLSGTELSYFIAGSATQKTLSGGTASEEALIRYEFLLRPDAPI